MCRACRERRGALTWPALCYRYHGLSCQHSKGKRFGSCVNTVVTPRSVSSKIDASPPSADDYAQNRSTAAVRYSGFHRHPLGRLVATNVTSSAENALQIIVDNAIISIEYSILVTTLHRFLKDHDEGLNTSNACEHGPNVSSTKTSAVQYLLTYDSLGIQISRLRTPSCMVNTHKTEQV